MLRRIGLAIALLCLSSGAITADETPTAAVHSARLFVDQIAPILRTRCLTCHGQRKQESGLRLDQASGLGAGGDRGETVVAGDPAASWLYRALDPNDDELQMPPDGPPLTAEELSAVRQWIEMGATWPPELTQLAPPGLEITEVDRSFWAFVPPPQQVPVPVDPSGTADDWSIHEIDRFVLAGIRASGHEPLAPADRQTLVRRLYFDLIGLPPTAGEVARFQQDDAPRAYERLVDELLDRPEYGQRWARHWLDLVRFAESDGFKADVYRPHAWRYRDYVVQSLNEDKPYDRFLQEQLAGDELFPDDPQSRVATGYLRLWPLEDNQKDVQRQWSLILQDVTEVTSEAVLAIGIRCARCHDHKYDPIPQRDYYRLQAFFAAMLPRDDLQVPARGAMQELRAWEQQTQPVRHAMQAVETRHVASLKQTIKAYPPYLQAIYDKPLEAWTPLDKQFAYLARPQVEKKPAAELPFQGEMRTQWNQLAANLQQHERLRPADASAVMSVSDVGRVAPPTYLADNPELAEVAPGFLSVLDPADATIDGVPGADSTGRRATLASWLTSPDHPLTARVMVNRMLQQHFGRGIVATANDFGRQGERPTHPELLDWLARRFVQDGWSLKKLHRLIVTSATYRQDTLRQADDLDLAMRTFRGWQSRRLDSDQIRDAMLHASGELQPYQPAPSVTGDVPARSIQLQNVRNRPDEWLNSFDGPDMFNSCARRFVTTTPLQSLLMVNSPWALQRAKALAQQILSAGAVDTDQRIQLAYQATLSRIAEPEELATARAFFAGAEPDTLERLTDLCHVLLCSNEFMYID
jgi:hypothetical protein